MHSNINKKLEELQNMSDDADSFRENVEAYILELLAEQENNSKELLCKIVSEISKEKIESVKDYRIREYRIGLHKAESIILENIKE